MRVCLDTNAYSHLRRGNKKLLELLNNCEEIVVPAATYAELMYGFLRGGKFAENESLLSEFLEEDHVLFQPVTPSIAERWGYIKSALAENGTPIPDNDIWIAATTLETGTRLVSYDHHFDLIGSLIRLSP
ncbi:MAG: type II toxin-antitoxin system VapC family toxin [Kiritimatiellae bacterium]|nr:type II toxin-antitoxin system VapC family toxin [Kiritimatiellia bacterium]